MKLLIAGSRSILSFDLSNYVSYDVDLIITGGASGVDRIAEEYADGHNISKLVIRPKYSIFGKSAPIVRNKEMIALADEILVIWDGKSHGTKFTIDHSKKTGKRITVIDISK